MVNAIENLVGNIRGSKDHRSINRELIRRCDINIIKPLDRFVNITKKKINIQFLRISNLKLLFLIKNVALVNTRKILLLSLLLVNISCTSCKAKVIVRKIKEKAFTGKNHFVNVGMFDGSIYWPCFRLSVLLGPAFVFLSCCGVIIWILAWSFSNRGFQ